MVGEVGTGPVRLFGLGKERDKEGGGHSKLLFGSAPGHGIMGVEGIMVLCQSLLGSLGGMVCK